MCPTSSNQSQDVSRDPMRLMTKFSNPLWRSTSSTEWQPFIAAIFLAALPVGSFFGQYLLSLQAGTQQVLLHHLTVMVVDWVFVPFNYFVVRVIDWRRGGRIYLIVIVSVILNLLTHAFWQYNGLDFGHMITKSGVVLPAGWIHLAFSILQMVLLVCFVFCRRSDASHLKLVTVIAVVYFVAMGICGYVMHDGFIVSDIAVSLGGLFFVLIYPKLAFQQSKARRALPHLATVESIVAPRKES